MRKALSSLLIVTFTAVTTLQHAESSYANPISFPTLPADKSIASILSSLTFSTDYIQVSRYNATTQKFEHYEQT